MWCMNDASETKRLADAINALALTMTEIMTERLRAANGAEAPCNPGAAFVGSLTARESAGCRALVEG